MKTVSIKFALRQIPAVAALIFLSCIWADRCSSWTLPQAAQTEAKPNQIEKQRTQLRKYLQDHQQYDLLGSLLEQELLEAKEQKTRETVAGELAQLYSWQLNSNSALSERLGPRLDELSQEFPTAISIETQTGIAYGRYRSAKSTFEEWIWQRNNQALRKDAETQFAEVVQRTTETITRFQELLETERQRLRNNAEPQPLNATPDEPAKSRRQMELENALAQFQYLTGWSRYYRSLTLSDMTRRKSLLQLSQTDFLALLDIPDVSSVTEMTPQWFPLNSEWTCRLLLGLGMSSQALEQFETAAFCFNLLSENRVPESIRSNQPVWKFQSTLFPEQLAAARMIVTQGPSNAEPPFTASFWSVVSISGLSWPEPSNEDARFLLRQGIGNLAQQNEFSIIDELIATYDVKIDGEDFYSKWMAGYVLLKQAEASRRDLLAIAIDEFNAALAQPQAAIPTVYRARCRYHLGFALFLDHQDQAAIDQFRRAATVLLPEDPELAEHSRWMQCQTMNRLATSDDVWKNALMFALGEFQSQFPNSKFAAQAAFLQILGQLDQQSIDQAITTLQTLKPDDANYQRGLFEICRLRHQQWSGLVESNTDSDQTAIEKAEQLQTAMAQLIQSARDYLNTASSSNERNASARIVRVSLFAIDALINQQQTDAATNWLSSCEAHIHVIESDRNLGSDYHFLVLKLARQNNDEKMGMEAAEWLLANAIRPEQRRGALVYRAQTLDDILSANKISGSNLQLDAVIQAYQRLVNDFEADDNSLTRFPAARVALYRLAELETQAGKFNEAAKSYRKLHDAVPNELAYLLGMARSEMSLKRFAEAANHWRTIANGLNSSDAAWLEAKYNLILCLQSQESENAIKVFQQTRLLMPDLPAEWKQKFDDLETQLNQL